MTFDLTAVILAVLSIITSIGLGLLQYGKTKAEARKANVEAQTDLVKVALEINKQEVLTLRDVINIQRETIKDKDGYIDILRKQLTDREVTIPLPKERTE